MNYEKEILIIKNFDEPKTLPCMQAIKSAASVPWTLLDNMKLLGQRQRTVYYSNSQSLTLHSSSLKSNFHRVLWRGPGDTCVCIAANSRAVGTLPLITGQQECLLFVLEGRTLSPFKTVNKPLLCFGGSC